MGQNSWFYIIALAAIAFYLIEDLLWRNGLAQRLIMPPSVLYYGLQFSWGLIQNILGAFVALVLIWCGYEVECIGANVWIKSNFRGNFSLGVFVFVNKSSSLYVLQHECGHSLQNCWYGPFALLCVSIPSLVRYWVRALKKSPYSTYFDIWFEAQASNSNTI